MPRSDQSAALGLERVAVWGAGLFAIALGTWFAWGSHDFCLDDAWIHLAYALSLKRGEGLSYNPFDHETGSSSPLWAAVLALWPWGDDPVLAVKLLGVLLHGAAAALSARLALELARPTDGAPSPSATDGALVALVAGALTAANPSLLQSATSGMEVSLTAALLLALLLAWLRGRYALASGLALLTTFARPECIFFCCTIGAMQLIRERRVRHVLPPLAALAGLGVWMSYCFAVSGYPWPNTKYAKGVGIASEGLTYLSDKVLADQPWLVGAGGLVLAGVALARARSRQHAWFSLSLGAAWLATLLATALSRPFTLAMLFYASRYFAIVAPMPHVLVALGLPQLRRSFALLLLVPVLVLDVRLATATYHKQRTQEADIRLLHVAPARYLAQHLPASSIVVVEGAGATRFFAPRSMRMIDLLGLNSSELVHAGSTLEHFCRWAARHPTHLLVPDQYLVATTPFEAKLVKRFVDPHYSIGDVTFAYTVHLFELHGLKPQARNLCKR